MNRLLLAAALSTGFIHAQLAIYGDTVYTMAGPPIPNGVVLVRDGKIERVGPAAGITVPGDYRSLRAKVVTPGLIDARTVVGLSGHLNQPHDQDQREASAPIQPDLRAVDAFNARERLVEYIRDYGITTIHTGHAPGSVVSGQTMIVKTGGPAAEQSVLVEEAMLAASLGGIARAPDGKSPGTRAKAVALLRAELIKAQQYIAKHENKDLRLEVLARVLRGELPLLVTVHRANDILTAIRVGKEFKIPLVLDGVAEAHLVLEEIKASGYPVILHPTMYRAAGETENLSMETAAVLRKAGIPFALESGFEAYVPKTRVVLFEAAVAAANGLGMEAALASITIDPARLLKIEKRVGSLEPGKDADIALFDGDPFEYTTHCVGVVIDGQTMNTESR